MSTKPVKLPEGVEPADAAALRFAQAHYGASPPSKDSVHALAYTSLRALEIRDAAWAASRDAEVAGWRASHENTEAARLLAVEQRDAARAKLDELEALMAKLASTPGYVAALYRMRTERDAARAEAASLRQDVDTLRTLAVSAAVQLDPGNAARTAVRDFVESMNLRRPPPAPEAPAKSFCAGCYHGQHLGPCTCPGYDGCGHQHFDEPEAPAAKETCGDDGPCGCDGAMDDGCWKCTPDRHQTPCMGGPCACPGNNGTGHAPGGGE